MTSYRWDQRVMRKKRKRYAVSVPAEVYERIRAEAERRRISLSKLVDETIRATIPEVQRP